MYYFVSVSDKKFFGITYFQYHGQGEKYSEALDYMNMIFTGVFTVEFILKLAAFRFKVRTQQDWNL